MIEPRKIEIKNHRIVGAAYVPTPNKGGALANPSAIVMHDTAGASAASSVAWLVNPQAKASAHVVIGRDGELAQLAPFNVQTWHAGRSVYRGRTGCNQFTIGIEHDNPGKLAPGGRAWFGTVYSGYEQAETAEHGKGYWMPYTEAQLAASAGLVIALAAKYPSLRDVVGHWLVSPGRKVDTNPLFPMESMLTALQGRGTPVAGGGASEIDNGPHGFVTVDGLNLRRWPTNNDNVLKVLPKGSRVDIERSGTYAEGFPPAMWHLVRAGGTSGWVHSAFVDERN